MIKYGLALGAGAARGLAHIGVIEVLEENGIKISYIAGCSIGSVVGACLAVHGNIRYLKSKVMSLTKKELWHLADLTTGKYGLIKGEKIRLFVDSLLNGANFQDTVIPLNIIATDLATGQEIVFKRGIISDAVRASISIPGVFQPWVHNGRTLVDGSLTNSTPVDIVRQMGADFVIGVDLPFTKFRERPTAVQAIMQGYEIMRERTIVSSQDTLIVRPKFPDIVTDHRFWDKSFIENGRSKRTCLD